jgi:hypothetical protein
MKMVGGTVNSWQQEPVHSGSSAISLWLLSDSLTSKNANVSFVFVPAFDYKAEGTVFI